MDLKRLSDKASSCTYCELGFRDGPAPFENGNVNASIFICGNTYGQTFIGKPGKLLNRILSKAGLDFSQIYTTHLIKCYLGSSEVLKESWIEACFPYVIAQIAAVRPKIVIALGKDVVAALMGEDSKTLSVINGVMFKYSKDISIMPTYNPSYLIKTGGQISPKFNETVKHFQRVRDMCYY